MSTVPMAPFTTQQTIPPRELSRSPSKGSPRRALGPLSPNLHVPTPNSSLVVVDGKPTTTPAGSPLKGNPSLTPAVILSMKESYGYSPYLNARKRSFSQVDGADDEESRVTRLPSTGREGSPHEGPAAFASAPAIHPASDDESGAERDDGPRPLGLPIETREGQSFSSLIDYDPAAASDRSRSAASSPSDINMEADAEPLSYAQTLKLRLKLAMYKVQTNQELLPFDALEILPTTTRPPSVTLAVQPPSDHREHSPERPTSLSDAPRLLPAPTLLPTAYSSRKIEYVRSSPPPSPPTTKEPEVATPIAARRVQKLMSLPASAFGNVVASPEKEHDLTSSVVKGQAASSLMELMRSG